MRVDRLLGGPEDRRVDAGRKRHTERIVSGDSNDTGVRADELVEVVRVAADDVVGVEATEERGLEHTHSGGHVLGRPVRVVFDVSPLRILPIEDAFEPHRQRSHAHLNEIPGVIDGLRQRSRQHNELPASCRGGKMPRPYLTHVPSLNRGGTPQRKA